MLKKKNNLSLELQVLLKKLKFKKGDNILLHSNIAGLYQFNCKNIKNNMNEIIFLIRKKIGKKGTLLIPTFNYDFLKGKKIDIAKQNSQVGFLGNYLLKKNKKNKTKDPIFSYLVLGSLKKDFLKSSYIETFGKNSSFELILKNKFKIFCFCCSPNKITFLHYIEKINKVPYRFDKKFTGILLKNKKKIKQNIIYFAGKKKINYEIKNTKIINLIDHRKFLETNFGRFNCYIADAYFLYRKISQKLKMNKYFLIK